MWIYKKINFNVDLWTVGHYAPINDEFIPENEYSNSEEAAMRVRYLNGGVLDTDKNDEPVKLKCEKCDGRGYTIK